jgi:hypothetical protein
MFLIENNYPVALGLTGGAIIFLYGFYEITQTIQIDEQGISLNSLVGEIRRFSWVEIVGIKSMSFMNPGIKVINQNGEAIEISALLGRYGVILETNRRSCKGIFERQFLSESISPEPQLPGTQSFDIKYEANRWGWMLIVLVLALAIYMFVGCLSLGNFLYIAFSSIFLFVVSPGLVIEYLRAPNIIATKKETLLIQFRSNLLRKPIQVDANEVMGIRFNHRRTMTQHGMVHPSTDISILLPGKEKVSLSGFIDSNEEIYIKLAAWLEKYTEDVTIEEEEE